MCLPSPFVVESRTARLGTGAAAGYRLTFNLRFKVGFVFLFEDTVLKWNKPTFYVDFNFCLHLNSVLSNYIFIRIPLSSLMNTCPALNLFIAWFWIDTKILKTLSFWSNISYNIIKDSRVEVGQREVRIVWGDSKRPHFHLWEKSISCSLQLNQILRLRTSLEFASAHAACSNALYQIFTSNSDLGYLLYWDNVFLMS